MDVSVIGFGAWAIGGSWGSVDDAESMRALHASIDCGVNFIDTADVYGDGRSERLVGQLRRERPRDTIWIATKAGRRLPKQTPEGYSRANLQSWTERSLTNLGVDAIDLLQLHCPHPHVYDRPEVFGVLDDLVRDGKLRYYGVSVETCDEALRAIRHPNVQSVQIIFNMFRLKPAEAFFPKARRQQVGVLARVPLGSGLLTGKLNRLSTFAADDHRQFNRNGQEFDKGETFSGVPFDTGLAAVERLRGVAPTGATMAQWALRWTLMDDAVTTTIPGARDVTQARENAKAADLPALSGSEMAAVRTVYDEEIRGLVHAQW
jgi:aryl-alcohol dehydrogenase-like predicted oxidoreductase